MTKDDLTKVFKEVVNVVDMNRDTVTIDRLDYLERKLASFRSETNIRAAICGLLSIENEAIDVVLDSVQKVIAAERHLLETNVDLKLAETLKRLSDKPLLMYAIAALV